MTAGERENLSFLLSYSLSIPSVPSSTGDGGPPGKTEVLQSLHLPATAGETCGSLYASLRRGGETVGVVAARCLTLGFSLHENTSDCALYLASVGAAELGN